MSVHVDVDIAIANGKARRHLEINRISGLGAALAPRSDDHGKNFEYEVILTGSRKTATSTTFKHNYSDDVLTLITEAIVALRLAGVDQA